jgi:hypothetical protein
MLRKKFIFEQEDQEMNDFTKLMGLAKKRIDPNDVSFVNSEGEDFSEFIDIQFDGIYFNFDGLASFLKFFFPHQYDGDMDAEHNPNYYEHMYDHRWEWRSEFADESNSEWNGGYILETFKSEHLEKLKDILNIVDPKLSKHIVKVSENDYKFDDDNGRIQIKSFFETFNLSDEIESVYNSARVAGVKDAVPKGIEEKYCNSLESIGVENYSNKYCFWKYYMSWSSAILIFGRFGTEDDSFLDLLFDATKDLKIKTPPPYYQIGYDYFDSEAFDNVFVYGINEILDDLSDEIEGDETINKEYYEVLSKVTRIGGMEEWIKSKNTKINIRILSVNPQTLKVNFIISDPLKGRIKKGNTTIDEIVNLLNYESLFEPTEFREHYLRFIQKAIL